MMATAGRFFRRAWEYLRYSDEAYARHLGVKFGTGCVIATRKWGTEPYLIELGNRVLLAHGVTFVNHDGGVTIFEQETPGFDVFGRIKIGDDTFIGNDVLILPGVVIGRNCIIGAGAVVSKSVPDNTVGAGNPIRFISTTDAYKAKMLPLNMGTGGMSPGAKRRKILDWIDRKEIKRENLSP